MNIIHISAECYPIAKVGGLADVIGALPKYQQKSGITPQVVMPFYTTNFTQNSTFDLVETIDFPMGLQTLGAEILRLKDITVAYDIFLIKIIGLFDREKVYGYEDDVERFIAFQIAALTWISGSKANPDIIHCHDHHTGLIPFMISQCHIYTALKSIPTVFSIHNAQYQGQFEYSKLHHIPAFDHQHIGLLDWDGLINPMAAAIKCSWRITTVSPTYLKELQKKANGLENLLEHEHPKSLGILNGIDPEIWNSKTDPLIIKNYAMKSIISGKNDNKTWICKEFGLDPSLPLFAFIGRFVYEKAADLLPGVIETIFSDSKTINILILGSGNENIEIQLTELKKRFKGNFNTYIGYNEKLSHIIYAGADFLIMPSRIEPCGLNQMYALRYGTIPIVRETGGLKDTVIDIGDGGVGICHQEATIFDISYSIQRGVTLYENQKAYRKIQKKGMQLDHSWDAAAEQYNKLYQTLIKINNDQ